MEEYQGVVKSLWDLIESQKRNTAQLARIRATVEKMWSSKGDLQGDREEIKYEEDRDKEERSKDGPKESQEGVKEGILSFTSC